MCAQGSLAYNNYIWVGRVDSSRHRKREGGGKGGIQTRDSVVQSVRKCGIVMDVYHFI